VARTTTITTSPGVNFTNILRAAFSFEIISPSLSLITVCICNFWQKITGAKAALKMLVKLTTGQSLVATVTV